ncbi:maleate cis-trans isomerase family protein [Nocardia macrotermitis]|uniref:Maleate isomerase n=1 Tax=Nocardia macrotermitis TaxID=2585198 RepID=A0A7K0D5A6_9NOCA|nr:GAF domain-containing protein [Nocardia macrotermitis]MQY20919.1 Maleate isomerase [Nocardia macrotermitis]
MYRVGMIVPSSNTCLEPTTYRMLSGIEGVSVHFARVPVTRIGLDAAADGQFALEPMLAAARLLADAGVDILVWNGTAGSWLGIDHDRALCAALAEATGIEVTTSTLALLEACHAYGVTRLGIAVPYTAEVTERIRAVYRGEGIDCVACEYLDITDNAAFAEVPEAQVRRMVTAAAHDAHAVAVVCTNVFGAAVAAGAEAESGIPVFDSVSATLWRALPAGCAVPGWGELLWAGHLRNDFQHAVETLLEATGADRTTLRIDLPEQGLAVDLTAAEGLRDGVSSIRRDASLDQRRLNTVEWLERHRELLVQNDFGADPKPPDALREVYGVRAQMLGPVVRGAAMVGWLSVHSLREREWGAGDREALSAAISAIHEILDASGKL